MSIKNNTTNLTALLEQVNNLPDAGGVELPTLSNEGSASDLLSGKQLIDQDGNIVTGTIATKTSSNLTASGATVTVPAGYYATQATKSVSTATQATPSVSIDSAGKITASATQSAGYVSAGTKTGTKQLTTKAATTWTPTTSNQTIASGTYLTGTQTIKGDSNLVADNIKSGTSIFGVTGSFEGSAEDLSAELTEQDSLLTELATVLAGKAAGGGESGGGAAIASKEISIKTRKTPTASAFVGSINYVSVDASGNLVTQTNSSPVYGTYLDAVAEGTFIFIRTINSPSKCTIYDSGLELVSFDATVGAIVKLTDASVIYNGFSVAFT